MSRKTAADVYDAMRAKGHCPTSAFHEADMWQERREADARKGGDFAKALRLVADRLSTTGKALPPDINMMRTAADVIDRLMAMVPPEKRGAP